MTLSEISDFVHHPEKAVKDSDVESKILSKGVAESRAIILQFFTSC